MLGAHGTVRANKTASKTKVSSNDYHNSIVRCVDDHLCCTSLYTYIVQLGDVTSLANMKMCNRNNGYVCVCLI